MYRGFFISWLHHMDSWIADVFPTVRVLAMPAIYNARYLLVYMVNQYRSCAHKCSSDVLCVVPQIFCWCKRILLRDHIVVEFQLLTHLPICQLYHLPPLPSTKFLNKKIRVRMNKAWWQYFLHGISSRLNPNPTIQKTGSDRKTRIRIRTKY